MTKNQNTSINKMPTVPEKRHYKRLKCELPVVLEFDGETISATSQNMSCGGMYLPLQNDTFVENKPPKIIAQIMLPDRIECIKLPAKISRFEKDIQNKLKGVALEFEGLYDNNRLEIDRFIKWKLLN